MNKWITNRKSLKGFWLVPKLVTLNGIMALILHYFTELESFGAYYHYVNVVEDGLATLSAAVIRVTCSNISQSVLQVDMSRPGSRIRGCNSWAKEYLSRISVEPKLQNVWTSQSKWRKFLAHFISEWCLLMQNGLSGNFILLSISSFQPKAKGTSYKHVLLLVLWALILGSSWISEPKTLWAKPEMLERMPPRSWFEDMSLSLRSGGGWVLKAVCSPLEYGIL